MPDFLKTNVAVMVIQSLPKNLRSDLVRRLQSSFGKPLLVFEQFALDGLQSLSTVTNRALLVDEGEILRVELSRSFSVANDSGSLTVVLYVFAAQGIRRVDEPTLLEIKNVRASAFGVGLHSGLVRLRGYHGATLGVALARHSANRRD